MSGDELIKILQSLRNEMHDFEYKNSKSCFKCGKSSASFLYIDFLGKSICADCRKEFRGLICNRCYSPRGIGSDSWYNIRLPNGGEALLCSVCIKHFKSITEDASTPDPKAISLLKSAYRDLSEAADLDPTSDHVQKNLESVKKIFTDLSIALPNRSDLKKSIAKEKKQTSSSGSDIKTKTSPKGETVKSSFPSHSRHFVHAAFLMLIFIVVLSLGFYYIYPFMAGFVSDMLPTELIGLIPLIYIVITIILCKYFWKRIFRRRWKQKNLFERFVEMALYCSFFFLFLFVLQSDKGIKTLHVSDLFKTGFLKAESDITKTNHSAKVTKKRTGVAYYQVRSGDSLSSISRRHGMTINELLRLNNFAADTIIHPGQKIIVSKTGK